jgi:hypothetical protein
MFPQLLVKYQSADHPAELAAAFLPFDVMILFRFNRKDVYAPKSFEIFSIRTACSLNHFVIIPARCL